EPSPPGAPLPSGWTPPLRTYGPGLLPSSDHDLRASSRLRVDRELVGEPLGATQPQAQPAPGGEAIAQRHVDIGDARPLVLERQAQATTQVVVQGFEHHRAAVPVLEHVASQ